MITLFFLHAVQAQSRNNIIVFPDGYWLEDTTTSAPSRPFQLARFEHVFAVLDEETAKVVANSAYLKIFSGIKQQTMVADEGHYRGIYIAGEENYVELFGPADLDLDGPPSTPGTMGIGLNTERVKGLEQIKLKLDKNGLSSKITSFHRTFGNNTVDWFRGLELNPPPNASPAKPDKPGTEIFIAEIQPGYFDVPEANKPASKGKDDLVSLRRYHQNDYQHKLMKSISGITLAITRKDWLVFRPMLLASGYKINEHNNEANVTGDVNMTFLFVPRENVGIRKIDFILNEGVYDKHIEILGRSRLEVGPESHAVWTFDPQGGK